MLESFRNNGDIYTLNLCNICTYGYQKVMGKSPIAQCELPNSECKVLLHAASTSELTTSRADSGSRTEGSKRLKSAENKYNKSGFISFSCKTLHVQTVSVFGHGLHYILKICQTFPGISMINQFHEFLDLIFGGFLPFGPIVRQA